MGIMPYFIKGNPYQGSTMSKTLEQATVKELRDALEAKTLKTFYCRYMNFVEEVFSIGKQGDGYLKFNRCDGEEFKVPLTIKFCEDAIDWLQNYIKQTKSW